MVERAEAALGSAQDVCCLRAQARFFGGGRVQHGSEGSRLVSQSSSRVK